MTQVDLRHCYYSCQPELPGFNKVVLRVPVLPAHSPEHVELTGDEARDRIVKFHLASAWGILAASGYDALAEAVSRAAKTLMGELSNARSGEESDADQGAG